MKTRTKPATRQEPRRESVGHREPRDAASLRGTFGSGIKASHGASPRMQAQADQIRQFQAQASHPAKASAVAQLRLDTFGGEFHLPLQPTATGDRGMSIKLEFEPKHPVEASKIAMVQTARTMVGARPDYGSFDDRVRSTGEAVPLEARENSFVEPTLEGAPGTHIDRSERNNPIYGTESLGNPQTDNLAGSTFMSNAGPGKRIPDPQGFGHIVENAWMSDGPELSDLHWGGQGGLQEFETTALCLEGPMAGTYLGSLAWGYDRVVAPTEGSGFRINLREPRVASKGVPTAVWMQAATRWNFTKKSEQHSGGGEWEDEDEVRAIESRAGLPLTAQIPGTLSDQSPSPIEITQRLRLIDSELEQAQIPQDQRRQLELEALALKAML